MNDRHLHATSGSLTLSTTNEVQLFDWEQVEQTFEHIVVASEQKISLLERGNPRTSLTYELHEGAKLHLAIASLSDATSSIRRFKMHKNSHLELAFADFAPGQKTTELICFLQDAGAEADIHVAAFAGENDQKEIIISFDHQAPKTYAKMQNYGVCEQEGRLVFSGVGHIHKGAKQSATHQHAKIMVFDPKCHAKADPILKIDENEVEASHAAAVGKVNEEHLFYLTSRGIDEHQAKMLITLGYLQPIFPYFGDSDLGQEAQASLAKRRENHATN